MNKGLPSNSQFWLAVRNARPPFNIFGFLAQAKQIVDEHETAPFTAVLVRGEGGIQRIIVPLQCIFHEDGEFGRCEVAIFSEDREIEFWRRVGGFTEAKTE